MTQLLLLYVVGGQSAGHLLNAHVDIVASWLWAIDTERKDKDPSPDSARREGRNSDQRESLPFQAVRRVARSVGRLLDLSCCLSTA